MKLVIDTNVLVAALRSRNGASNALLVRVLEGPTVWLCSVPMFLEYEDVLMRADFVLDTGHSRTALSTFLTDIADAITPVDLNFLWRPQLPDPKDEMVLETAANGGADAIVTFNTKDFRAAAPRFGLDLLTPAKALERIPE